MKTLKRKVIRKNANMHGNAVQAKIVTCFVTKEDIETAECRNPNKCMIKVALKRALNLAHGYIHVDASGISISRNGRYREKAFMPRTAQVRMLAFDSEKPVSPFRFKLTFFKTTKVKEASEEQKESTYRSHKKSGTAKKKYDMRSRVIGVAVAGDEKLAA